ncbi:hypothetical protein BDY21DRAFT_212573 [Lineolata rhizophorae]|uniref:Uncharacterized protein n=1 Tax=Lineolata rhizophorae TaxID=578093 RepID=A0A6A6P461_9PEZI|nr:hypothetical protein BDY21DRAFT_212573 [Lineolata rhizophorae]
MAASWAGFGLPHLFPMAMSPISRIPRFSSSVHSAARRATGPAPTRRTLAEAWDDDARPAQAKWPHRPASQARHGHIAHATEPLQTAVCCLMSPHEARRNWPRLGCSRRTPHPPLHPHLHPQPLFASATFPSPSTSSSSVCFLLANRGGAALHAYQAAKRPYAARQQRKPSHAGPLHPSATRKTKNNQLRLSGSPSHVCTLPSAARLVDVGPTLRTPTGSPWGLDVAPMAPSLARAPPTPGIHGIAVLRHRRLHHPPPPFSLPRTACLRAAARMAPSRRPADFSFFCIVGWLAGIRPRPPPPQSTQSLPFCTRLTKTSIFEKSDASALRGDTWHRVCWLD